MAAKNLWGEPYPHGTAMWNRGDSEDHLLGFATRAGLDAYQRGDAGPFERVLRDPTAPPPTDEVLMARALCGGTVRETMEYLRARQKPSKTKH